MILVCRSLYSNNISNQLLSSKETSFQIKTSMRHLEGIWESKLDSGLDRQEVSKKREDISHPLETTTRNTDDNELECEPQSFPQKGEVFSP